MYGYFLVKYWMKQEWDGLISTNPVSMVKSPKNTQQTEVTPFSHKEINTLLDSCDEWMRTFLTIAFFTGMRSGELIALKWEDIDFNSGKIHVRRSISAGREGSTKTGKNKNYRYSIPCEDRTAKEIS